ncbi:hypothetical protein TNCV_93571 [Trichonephila clavipes]|nr:hypothetical protein TNCV_93571 [Trichonephila clavipes]
MVTVEQRYVCFRNVFSSRGMPNHKLFQRLHRQLCENGLFNFNTDELSRRRTVRLTHLEEVILDCVDETPRTSTRTVACRLHVSQPTVWIVLLLVDAISKTVLTFSQRKHLLSILLMNILCFR